MFILIVFLFFPIKAQEDKDLEYKERRDEVITLFGDHVSHGGYGAFILGYSEIDNMDAIVIGGRGSWIIGHWIAIGFGGLGFINDMHYNDVLSQNVNLTGGYGGMVLEPIILPKIPVHISAPVLFGVGGVAYMSSYGSTDWDDPNYYAEDATSFLVIEPGVDIELNVIRSFRLALGVSYRYTSEINLFDTPVDALNGLSYNISLKFGKF
ncbi:MAG: hypothetical protein AMS27_09605 [Bacteroides sp. SM23_62_1]|nr:MAG: hypothetical protein AMS27_09605 [Bacteroides sp. SM23_62_1]